MAFLAFKLHRETFDMELFNTYSIGEHFIPAIVNADYSCLTDKEAIELSAWIKSITIAVSRDLKITYEDARAYVYLVCGHGEHFSRCEAGRYYSTCHPVHVYIR